MEPDRVVVHGRWVHASAKMREVLLAVEQRDLPERALRPDEQPEVVAVIAAVALVQPRIWRLRMNASIAA
jgi:hypothetical protein